MEVAGSGHTTCHVGTWGRTVTVKWQAALTVPKESITVQTTTFVPIGKFDPLGGLQLTTVPGGQLLTTGGGYVTTAPVPHVVTVIFDGQKIWQQSCGSAK